MRVCLITFNPDQPGGGSELLWRRLALELCRRHHEVHVAAPGIFNTDHPEVLKVRNTADSATDLSYPTLNLAQRLAHKILPHRIWHPHAKDPLQKWLHRIQPQLVFISLGGFKANLERLVAAGVMQYPYIVVTHGNRPDDWIEDQRLPIFRDFHQKSLESWFVSQAARKFAQDALQIKPEHWQIMQNPMLLDFSDSAHAFHEVDSEEDLKFAMVGSIHYESKAQDLLIKAFDHPELRKHHFKINIFGKGPNQVHLQHWIQERNLGQWIEMKGHQSDIRAIWKDHHLCLFTSRYEGLPIAMVEAQWCGRPVVTTDVGGCSEIIQDGFNGFIIPKVEPEHIAETLLRVLHSRDQLARMSKNSALKIRQLFSEEPTQRQVERILELLHTNV